MNSFINRLREALSYEYSLSRVGFRTHNWPSNDVVEHHTVWTMAQENERARTKMLESAIIEAIKSMRCTFGDNCNSSLSRCTACAVLYEIESEVVRIERRKNASKWPEG